MSREWKRAVMDTFSHTQSAEKVATCPRHSATRAMSGEWLGIVADGAWIDVGCRVSEVGESSLFASVGSAAAARGKGHRRVQSDAQAASPTLERLPQDRRSRAGSPVDDETDPFKKQKKLRAGGLTPQMRGGSFRKIFSSPEEGTASPSDDSTPGTKKKNVINKILQRARANSRDKLGGHLRTDSDVARDSDWLDNSDSSSEGKSRTLERQDSVVIHDAEEDEKEKPTRAVSLRMLAGRTPKMDLSSNPPVVAGLPAAQESLGDGHSMRLPAARQRGGAMIVKETPKAMVEAIQQSLARIYDTFEKCSAPLRELEAMRVEGEAGQDEASNSLTVLNNTIGKVLAQSNLSEYEEVAEELAADSLMAKFKFGSEQLLDLDDRLSRMEMLVLASLKLSRRDLYLNYAIAALCVGMVLAWIF